ncbi:hypothetical protein KUTeg_012043 [Tegillarca granosa]|uniref:Uncharacterized protein n=1 Tax=Tegillarca granosa TaxID=220873 RepID=A0ABQ9EYF1_TEGGR|nr:hypothetical protein KUTeg_012043 [Tegillarca granosa]
MESIQQLIRYCLLFWYDNERNWSIVSSNSIIKPRREPDEYKEGDIVLEKFKGKPYNAAIVRVQGFPAKIDIFKKKKEFNRGASSRSLNPGTTDNTFTILYFPQTFLYYLLTLPQSIAQNIFDVCPLDLLALTVETKELKSENQQLREQLAKVVLENENLRREQHKSLEKNSKFSGRETPLSATELNDSHVKNNFKYYTGFVYEQFRHIYSFLVSGDYGLPFTYTKASSCWRTIKVEISFC